MQNVIQIDKPFLGSADFLATARLAVLDVVRNQLDPTDNVEIGIDDVYEVTHSYILGNQKAMISTTLPDGKYYEVTYSASTKVIYIDTYVKVSQNVLGVALKD